MNSMKTYRAYNIRLFLVFAFFITTIYFFLHHNEFLSPNTYESATESQLNNIEPKIALKKIDINFDGPDYNSSNFEKSKLGIKDLALLTFISENHVSESIISCQTILQLPELKGRPFYVFVAEDVTNASETIYKAICPIAKIINYGDMAKHLPPEFSLLRDSYRFKPICVMYVLQRHPIALFVDASVRFENKKESPITDLIKRTQNDSEVGLAMVGNGYHYMYSATHPDVYKHFPEVNVTLMRKTYQMQSGFTLFFGTPSGWRIATRYVQCAFERDCLAPPGSSASTCTISDIWRKPNVFSGCHRFDQSALNLIGYVESKGNYSKYAYTNDDIFHITRAAKV